MNHTMLGDQTPDNEFGFLKVAVSSHGQNFQIWRKTARDPQMSFVPFAKDNTDYQQVIKYLANGGTLHAASLMGEAPRRFLGMRKETWSGIAIPLCAALAGAVAAGAGMATYLKACLGFH